MRMLEFFRRGTCATRVPYAYAGILSEGPAPRGSLRVCWDSWRECKVNGSCTIAFESLPDSIYCTRKSWPERDRIGEIGTYSSNSFQQRNFSSCAVFEKSK